MNRRMCVKIARDVLAQLRLRRYKATPGIYVQIDSPELTSIINNKSCTEYDKTARESFKDFFKSSKKTTCQVCAIGAAFVSLVNIENKCSVDEMCADKSMWERLEKYFGSDNMDLMESAFECYTTNNFSTPYEMQEVAAEWGSQYKNPTDRLRAIMLNVIRNKGDFKLPKKYLAKYMKGE